MAAAGLFFMFMLARIAFKLILVGTVLAGLMAVGIVSLIAGLFVPQRSE
jgi:hypothetical protein